MGIVLKFVIPIILLAIGVICFLVGKKNGSNTPSLIGLVCTLVAGLWFVIGTF